MKKILHISLIMLLLFGLSFNSSAITYNDNDIPNRTIEYFDDGSYMETIISSDENISVRSTYSKSGKKTVTFYNSEDVAQWSITISGTFSYTGSSATCTSASISHTIIDSNWEITSESATKSGNQAIGSVQAKRYFLGICTRTVNKSVTLTCSANGTLS